MQLPTGGTVPTSHDGAFRLVVKREYPICVEVPACTGSPTIYSPTFASARVVEVRSSAMVLDPPDLVTPIMVRSQTVYLLPSACGGQGGEVAVEAVFVM